MVIALNERQEETRLLARAQLPSWADASPFVLSGYRPESNSWINSLASWVYVHNETANIYSHLVPGLLLILATTVNWDLRGVDGAIVALQMAVAILCLFISTFYHTGLNHSEAVAHKMLQLDYVGILILILGNFVSGLHFGFYCDIALRDRYWSLVNSEPQSMNLSSLTSE